MLCDIRFDENGNGAELFWIGMVAIGREALGDECGKEDPKQSKACGSLLQRWGEIELACGTVGGGGTVSRPGLGRSP